MNKHFQGLAHIGIYTQDIAASEAFYQRLGGSVEDRGSVPTPRGEKKLAMVSFAGLTLELIQDAGPMPMGEGNIPHFAVRVDDLDAAAALLRDAGASCVIEKRVLPELFGGLENCFFAGPSGEQIELLHSL